MINLHSLFVFGGYTVMWKTRAGLLAGFYVRIHEMYIDPDYENVLFTTVKTLYNLRVLRA